MVLQCVAIGACLVALDPLARGSALGGPLLWLRDIAVWSAAVVTVWSGVAYSQRAIAMLSRHD